MSGYVAFPVPTAEEKRDNFRSRPDASPVRARFRKSRTIEEGSARESSVRRRIISYRISVRFSILWMEEGARARSLYHGSPARNTGHGDGCLRLFKSSLRGKRTCAGHGETIGRSFSTLGGGRRGRGERSLWKGKRLFSRRDPSRRN